MSQPLNIASRLAAVAASERPERPAPRDELAWETMDVDTLPKAIQDQFIALLKAQEAERVARKAISEALVSVLDLPSTLTVRVAAKWGKLSVAIDSARKPSTGKAAMSMAQLVELANRRAV